jgi:hypothetical protein
MALNFLPGVKRRAHRSKDAATTNADKELSAKRQVVLETHQYECAGCAYVVGKNDQGRVNDDQARHLDVHHINDDHTDNSDENLVPACHACHPYQHIGQHALGDSHVNTAGKTLLATIPEVSAADLNLLLRALGAVLNAAEEFKGKAGEATYAGESAIAQEILDLLCERSDVTLDAFCIDSDERAKTFLLDVAKSLSVMSDSEYEGRGSVLGDQRLLFNPKHLIRLGAEFSKDYRAVPVDTWGTVFESAIKQR